MTLLTDTEIGDWVSGHGSWTREGPALVRTVECPSFPAAIDLVDRVAQVAEERNHHPDIDIRWRTLRFEVSTHSEGGLTANDLALAEAIDGLAGSGS